MWPTEVGARLDKVTPIRAGCCNILSVNGARPIFIALLAACSGAPQPAPATAVPQLKVRGEVVVTEGESTTFSIELVDGPPKAALRGHVDLGAYSDKATITPSEFELSPTQYSAAMTITGTVDADSNDESFDMFAKLDGASSAQPFPVLVIDRDSQRPIPSTWKIAMNPSTTASFAVRLTQSPSTPISISVQSADNESAFASPQTLTFSDADYSVPQTVTVTATQNLGRNPTSIGLFSDLPTATVVVVSAANAGS